MASHNTNEMSVSDSVKPLAGSVPVHYPNDINGHLFARKNRYFSPDKLLEASALNSAAVPAESIDLIITSPPYNVGLVYDDKTDDAITYQEYLEFSRRWMTNCFQWSKKNVYPFI